MAEHLASVSGPPATSPAVDDGLLAVRCRACDASAMARSLEVREQNLGLGDRFRYGVCSMCGSLTLLDPPKDLLRYYPRPDYYAHRSRWPVLLVDRVLRSRASFGSTPRMGHLLARWELEDTSLLAVGRLALPRDASILDVGAGSGRLLENLARLGYPRVAGVDPYLADGAHSPRVRRGGLDVVPSEERFDLIMFHHSLEHTPEPAAMLTRARAHLASTGIVLLRLPLVGAAFDRFGASWYGIDAPRHFFVPTIGGLRRLLERTGFAVRATYCDSTSAQYLVSREFELGGSARRRHSVGAVDLLRERLTSEWRTARREAAAANLRGTGDQIVIEARPSSAA